MGARVILAIGVLVVVVAAGAGCAPAVEEPSRPTEVTATPVPASSTATRDVPPSPAEPSTTSGETKSPPAGPTPDRTRELATPAVPSLMPAPLLPGRVPPAVGVDPVERAVGDLAGRLGVEPAEIELVTVYTEDFPSGDLGCTLPKEAPPAELGLVMGQEIVLSAGGTVYFYRVSGGMMVFCGER
jgi:hypothetical protein